VLTATALHWLPAERVAALYAEIWEVLRPGGIVVNADHMPEESLPALSERLRRHARARREARYATGAATSWPEWWRIAAAGAAAVSDPATPAGRSAAPRLGGCH
jgi:SAM-dependent methyltransferase